MCDGGFGGVVDGLIERDVDDVRADGGGDDQVPRALPLEDGAGGFGAVDDAVDWWAVSDAVDTADEDVDAYSSRS